MEKEKNAIQKKESRAKRLEQLEAQLLKRLQNTQMMEREAFTELEGAMIDSSVPKRERY